MNKLKEYRNIKKIDVTSLANAVGISKRHLQFIESGERIPSLPVAKKIADYLNDSIDHIFYGNEGK